MEVPLNVKWWEESHRGKMYKRLTDDESLLTTKTKLDEIILSKFLSLVILFARTNFAFFAFSHRAPKMRSITKLRASWECGKIKTEFLSCMHFLHWK